MVQYPYFHLFQISNCHFEYILTQKVWKLPIPNFIYPPFPEFFSIFELDFTFDVIILLLLLLACWFVSRNLSPGPLTCYVLGCLSHCPKCATIQHFLESMVVLLFIFLSFSKLKSPTVGLQTHLSSQRRECVYFSLLLEQNHLVLCQDLLPPDGKYETSCFKWNYSIQWLLLVKYRASLCIIKLTVFMQNFTL